MKQFQHFFYLFLLVFLTACDGDSFTAEDNDEVNPLEPTTTVELTIDNTYVDAANPVTVTAKVQTDGVAVENIVVTFSSEVGLFDIESSTALTDSDGIATIGLTAGPIEGAGTIIASIETGETGTIGFESAGDGIDPNAGQNQGDTENIVLVKMSISARQVSTIAAQIITANISDLDGPVEGAVVEFSTTSGYLLPSSGSALTKSNGNATIIINADNIEGAGTVTATAPNGETATISFNNAGDGGAIAGKQVKLSLSTNDVSAASPATVMATVTDEKGVVIGEVVNFSSTLGVLDPFSGTALTSTTGVATITITAGNVEGAGLINATLATGEFDSIGFSTTGDAPAVSGNQVSLSISNTKIDEGGSVDLTAIVTNIEGETVSGVIVNFAATLGALSPNSGTALTNDQGIAIISLKAGPTAGAGVASVTLDNGANAKVNFETSGEGETSPEFITLTIDNTSIDKDNFATIIAKVSNGVDDIKGVVVNFTTTLGILDPKSGTALTDVNGEAVIILNAGDVEGAGLVTATTSNGQVDTVGFETTGDQVSVITVEVMLVEPGTTNEISVINATNPGQLIATVTGTDVPVIITFSTDIGEIPIPTAITSQNIDGDYQAFVDIYAGNHLGAGTVTATLKNGETGERLLVVGANNLKMGTGIPFTENVAELSLAQVSAGGTSVVTVDIVDENDIPYTLPVEVTFNSNCALLGDATLSSPITTSNGSASSTYLAQGCVGDDPITVSANAGGVNLTASTTINVLGADAGSIEFVSATPENISLQGVGGVESSTVIFRVLDTNGNPVANEEVDFSLNTNVGEITLDPIMATTNSEGYVQTVVNSGTVSTTVRLTASIVGSSPLISSQSSKLVISTGIPDQDSFGIAALRLNIERIYGNTETISVFLADAFNNPVPDGTSVYFTTEGARIDDECETLDSKCTVTFTVQDPIPNGDNFVVEPTNLNWDPLIDDMSKFPSVINTMGQGYGSRITILATAIGEESFADTNGNGRFDVDEIDNFLNGADVADKDYNLPEAFVDHNEDNVYNPQVTGGEVNGENEEFSDFNVNGLYDAKDNFYNGVLCSIPAHIGCASEDPLGIAKSSLNVRDSLVMVLSTQTAYAVKRYTIDAIENDDVDNALLIDDDDNTVYIVGENTGAASIVISDGYNQPMPAGTVVEFTSTAGSIVGPDTFVWPSHNKNGGTEFSVSIEGEDEPKSGSLIVQITTPGGTTTTKTLISVVILAVAEEPEPEPVI